MPAATARDNNKELNELIEEFNKDMLPNQEDISGGSDSSVLYPDPMDKIELPNMIFRFRNKQDNGTEEPEFGESFGDAMKELNEMIGLDSVKKDVKEFTNLVVSSIIRKKCGFRVPDMSLHLCIHRQSRYRQDHGGLVAGYVGQTAIKMREVIDKTKGGILFIDGAYALAPPHQDFADFGQEAIDTILKATEDHRSDFVVIVAGYDDLMHRFINSNPGLKSRFKVYPL